MTPPVAGEWFLAATFRFEPRPDADTGSIKKLLEKRHASQPIGAWSCGSVFTNPPGGHAAQLIEGAGLKGHRIGGAMVSEKHANFIVNEGEATAADLEALVRHVQNAVERVHGVRLVPEVRVIGEARMSRLRSTGVEFRRISSAAGFGRVAVLMGGASAEREVSLMTGNAVLEALLARGVDAAGFDPAGRALTELVDANYDRVFIALHGPGGEDGAVQGALEWLGLPYTGSGVLGSAIGMDKLRTKRLAQASGVATPRWIELTGAADFDRAVAELGLPLAVKPATQGSSVGMSRVAAAAELPAAWRAASALDPVVIAERWITSGEYTVAVLQGAALPAIRIETPRAFYDYQAKYFADDTRYLIPCGLDPDAESALQRMALVTFAATGASGWVRVDFVMDEVGQGMLLEINTVPGMTGHSLVPMAAQAAGIDFPELVWRVLETSFARERT